MLCFRDYQTIEHQTRVKAPVKEDFIAQLLKRQKRQSTFGTYSRHFMVQSVDKCNKLMIQSVDIFHSSS